MASSADVERLKALAPEAVLSERYPTDGDINTFLDSVDDDVRRAAGLLWEERVAQTAHFVDITEGSTRRSMEQEFQHAVQLATRYLGSEFMADSGSRPAARVHQIERREA